MENRKKDFYLGLLEYNEFGEDISTYKFNRKQEKELDKRFISKEELKDKINKIFNNHNCYFSDKFDEFELNNIKKEILELLKEE